MKNFENAIWFDDNVSRVHVLTIDHSGEVMICFTDRHMSMHFTMKPIDAEKFAANILAASITSQIKSAA